MRNQTAKCLNDKLQVLRHSFVARSPTRAVNAKCFPAFDRPKVDPHVDDRMTRLHAHQCKVQCRAHATPMPCASQSLPLAPCPKAHHSQWWMHWILKLLPAFGRRHPAELPWHILPAPLLGTKTSTKELHAAPVASLQPRTNPQICTSISSCLPSAMVQFMIAFISRAWTLQCYYPSWLEQLITLGANKFSQAKAFQTQGHRY